jgi:polysaccharide biosynthesis transport protein
MKSFAMFREGSRPGWSYGPGFELPAAPASRRRLLVFCGVFLLACVVGLTYTFARPAQYRAVARLQITPPAALAPAAPPTTGTAAAGSSGASPEPASPLLGEIQILTSRPLLEQAWERLQRAGEAPTDLGEKPVDSLQSRLGATAIEGTQVVELWAVGREPARLPSLVNTLVDVYTEHLGEAYQSASADTLVKARGEAAKLDEEVAAKRARVKDFQLRYNIVSLERDEHALLSRVKAMSTAFGVANERVVKAEAQLRSLQESAAAGRSVVRAKDNPTLAGIEQRVSQLREELRDLERSYAPAYLAMDPQARAKRARLEELEEQMRVERGSSQAAAITEAQEELVSARGAANQLQQQMAGDRREVQEFSLRFTEYKSLQEELDRLEGLYRGAQERVVRLEASEEARRPEVAVIERAELPGEVWSPRYGRDAAISVAAALVLALFAVWLVDFIRPRQQEPAMVMPQPWWVPLPVPTAGPPRGVLAAAEVGLLPAAAPSLPRELARAEAAALLAAAGGPARLAVAALLAGLSADELLALRWEDIDRERGVARVGGAAPRDLPLAGVFLEALENAGLATDPPAAGPLLQDPQGRALGAGELDALILCAAHDGGVEAPAEVTAAALRHTYVAYLVRQGVRFADLPAAVGPLPVAALAAYSALAPAGPRVAAERVDWVYRCHAEASSPPSAH